MLGRGRALAAIVLAACSAGGMGRPDASTPGRDAARDTGRPMDAGTSCTTDVECDDGFPCTIDECIVGNVCRHEPLDSRCTAPERCVVGRGCVEGTPTECTTAADCDDGQFCNGAERCLASRCAPPASAPSCDDGNACTVDRCDEARDGCAYDLAPGCDAGTPFDAGTPCDTFDPTMHYGSSAMPITFTVAPRLGSSCGPATYDIRTMRFVVTAAGNLEIEAGPFTLRQSPAPTGPSFDAFYVQSGCGTYRVRGTFECANQFSADWIATLGEASCSFCPSRTIPFVGRR